jgi:dTDP-4-amino-4,6-dideoxygalactose transaminase
MVSRKITLGTLNISDTGKRYVNDALNNNRLSRGKYTEAFERQFSYLHGCKYGIFLNSGTSALQVALAALKEYYGYEGGDEVIVPATTFIATSNIVIQNGLIPVFVDVDPYTFNIAPKEIEAAITPRTRCIIPVHLFGLPADMPKIVRIAQKHGLQIIEDSCETMFADTKYKHKPVGSFGNLACFSTYVAHLIVGGVGGLITGRDPKLEEICRSLMAHGRDSIYTNIDQDDSDDAALRKQMIERRYSFERVGYSYRATELEAALALSELERWSENITTRRANAHFLTDLLSDLPQLRLPYIPTGFTHSFMMFPMVVNEDRDKLLMYMEERGIETRYLFPLLSQPIYRKLFPGLEDKFPVAKDLAENGFFIGMHQGLTTEDIEYVSEVIHNYFKGVA